MRSKKSKKPTASIQTVSLTSTVEQGCSEEKLRALARKLASLLQPGDRVLLEGEMGAGKTTFARALLEALGVHQPPEGSPSFAIVHEYSSDRGMIAHMDLYRIRHELELEEAGLSSYFWERKMIVISEWLSLWPNFMSAVRRSGRCYLIRIDFESEETRKLSITLLHHSGD